MSAFQPSPGAGRMEIFTVDMCKSIQTAFGSSLRHLVVLKIVIVCNKTRIKLALATIQIRH